VELEDGVVGNVLVLMLADELEGERENAAADDRRMYPGKLALGDTGKFKFGFVVTLPVWLVPDMMKMVQLLLRRCC
jgi:hypothetical protein